ncbi:MAG TPA: isochorismatase family cysteine hydrolase [Burkholderiales bacterium]
MHDYRVREHVRQRVLKRKGRPLSLDAIDCARAALLVVDMQNYFVAPGFPQEVPVAREIVPAINRMAAAMRSAGGTVAWIQTTATGALQTWGNHHRYGMSPEVSARRLATLAEDAEGYRLWHALEPSPVDLRVKKIKFSAMLPGSSDLHEVLTRRGVDTVLVAGTTTNVCCESTARDAMMLDYRVAMLSDATAARSDEEHAASLDTFHVFFGDVMTVDEASARLVAVVRARTA